MSKTQSVLALTRADAEYVAATQSCQNAIQLQGLCKYVGLNQGPAAVAIALERNPTYHVLSKQDVQYYFISLERMPLMH